MLRSLVAFLYIIGFYLYNSINGEPFITAKLNNTYVPVHKRVTVPGKPTTSFHHIMKTFFDSHYKIEKTIDFTRSDFLDQFNFLLSI